MPSKPKQTKPAATWQVQQAMVKDRDLHSHMMVVATRAFHAAGDVPHKVMLRAICRAIAADKNLMRKLAATLGAPVDAAPEVREVKAEENAG